MNITMPSVNNLLVTKSIKLTIDSSSWKIDFSIVGHCKGLLVKLSENSEQFSFTWNAHGWIFLFNLMVKMVIKRRGDCHVFFFWKKIIIQTQTQRREREEEQATIMHLSLPHLPPGVFAQHVYCFG